MHYNFLYSKQREGSNFVKKTILLFNSIITGSYRIENVAEKRKRRIQRKILANINYCEKKNKR